MMIFGMKAGKNRTGENDKSLRFHQSTGNGEVVMIMKEYRQGYIDGMNKMATETVKVLHGNTDMQETVKQLHEALIDEGLEGERQ